MMTLLKRQKAAFAYLEEARDTHLASVHEWHRPRFVESDTRPHARTHCAFLSNAEERDDEHRLPSTLARAVASPPRQVRTF